MTRPPRPGLARGLLAGALLAAPAAGGEQPQIVGGEPTTGFPAVAALVDGEGELFCTASLVGPSCLLTAAHCFETGLPEGTQAFFGHDLAAEPLFRITVREVHIHPGWEPPPTLGVADLAVLELVAATDIPPLATTTAGGESGSLTLVGFGYDDSFVDGIKRTATAEVLDVSAGAITHDGTVSNTCAGDSGGPLLREVSGELRIAGVVSGGDEGCDEFGVGTRVDVHLEDFVGPAAQECTATAVGSDLFLDGFEDGLGTWSERFPPL